MQVFAPVQFTMRPRSLADCLDADPGMARLSAQAGRLLKLQQIFEAAIPQNLARQGRVANMKPGTITIYARTGAIAAKIRQLAPRLAEAFRQAAVDINEIVVKVQPEVDVGLTRMPRSSAQLGPATKQGLTSLARNMAQQSPLRQAIERLVERAQVEARPDPDAPDSRVGRKD